MLLYIQPKFKPIAKNAFSDLNSKKITFKAKYKHEKKDKQLTKNIIHRKSGTAPNHINHDLSSLDKTNS